MFGILKKKEGDNSPEWLTELTESKERWFAFLEKLEAKLEEFCTASIPELKKMQENNEEDNDAFQRTFNKIKSGIDGQIESIRKKASETYDEKVKNLYIEISNDVSVLNPHHSLLTEFRTQCSNRYHNEFDEKFHYWQNQVELACKKDLEPQYAKILAEYEATKNKFTCKQCSATITIPQIFFIETLVTCNSCGTQNTFTPSSLSKSLESIAQELAEQRTAHLYQKYTDEKQKERDFYFKIHENRTTLNDDVKTKKSKEIQNESWSKERDESINNVPIYYKEYIVAKYNEWIKIIPDFETHLLTRMNNEINNN